VPAEQEPEAVARLRSAEAFLFDLDGTLVLGDRHNSQLSPLPGAVELVEHLVSHGVPLAVLTNGTARSPSSYAAMLREIGFNLSDSAMLTPAQVAVDICLRRGHTRVMVLGGEGLAAPLREAGIEIVLPTGRESADAVVVGWFREFGFEHLEAACHAVSAGARLYSASQSLFFASADGKVLGTSRAICSVIRDVTGRRPEVVGKPSPEALRTAARRLGVRTREMVVVGDDPELEVPMARRGQAFAVAVNTGIGHAGSFAGLDPRRRPHLVVEGVGELLDLYRSGSPPADAPGT
jgi:4-nitrophenyl phosphatase